MAKKVFVLMQMPRSDVDTFTTETSRPITARNSSLPTEFARQSFASQRFVADSITKKKDIIYG